MWKYLETGDSHWIFEWGIEDLPYPCEHFLTEGTKFLNIFFLKQLPFSFLSASKKTSQPLKTWVSFMAIHITVISDSLLRWL